LIFLKLGFGELQVVRCSEVSWGRWSSFHKQTNKKLWKSRAISLLKNHKSYLWNKASARARGKEACPFYSEQHFSTLSEPGTPCHRGPASLMQGIFQQHCCLGGITQCPDPISQKGK
jgi:hypothetical protein